jgi:hypothetical protein
MINMTTIQCPQCLKVYITKIVVRQTVAGGRPTLIFPVNECTGIDQTVEVAEGNDPKRCGFPFTSLLQVESFDIPINLNPSQQKSLITKP